MTPFISIIVGLTLLFAGRRIFWLAVAAIGFIAGLKLATLFADGQSESTLILIALGIGLLSALAAILLQKIAVGLVGFVAGGYGAMIGMENIGLNLGNLRWVPIVLVGVAGLIIAAFVFEWALILLSSLVGAYLLVSQFRLNYPLDGMLFIILSIIGIIIQSKSMKKKKPGKENAPGIATSK